MPIYEYKCDLCGQRFEVFLRSQDLELTQCLASSELKVESAVLGACPGKLTKLVPRGTGFILAGGGWSSSGYGDKR